MQDRVWIVPVGKLGYERTTTDREREELREDGYGEFRAVCVRGPQQGQEARIFVEAWPRDGVTAEIARGAAYLLIQCETLQVFRPDGSQLLP
jgi:hypothetical protein